MTKRVHMSTPSTGPRKRTGSNLSWLLFALLVGCAVAFGFGFVGDGSDNDLVAMKLKLSDGLQQGVARAPNVLAPYLHH